MTQEKKSKDQKSNFLQKFLASNKEKNERQARRAVLEDLFYDLHSSRREIYTMNFFRGIFFGLGSVLGGTIVVTLIIWSLSFFTDLPFVGEQIQQVQESLRTDKNNNK